MFPQEHMDKMGAPWCFVANVPWPLNQARPIAVGSYEKSRVPPSLRFFTPTGSSVKDFQSPGARINESPSHCLPLFAYCAMLVVILEILLYSLIPHTTTHLGCPRPSKGLACDHFPKAGFGPLNMHGLPLVSLNTPPNLVPMTRETPLNTDAPKEKPWNPVLTHSNLAKLSPNLWANTTSDQGEAFSPSNMEVTPKQQTRPGRQSSCLSASGLCCGRCASSCIRRV